MSAPPPRKPYRVFVSSTYLDNEFRRELVARAIVDADMVPVGMERFTATTNPVVKECLQQAKDADVTVLIVARRYGWIPPEKDASITELECTAARQVLAFYLSDKVPFTEQDLDLDDPWGKQALLQAFKKKFEHEPAGMAARFTDHELQLKVYRALERWRAEREAPAGSETRTKRRRVDLPPDLREFVRTAAARYESLPLTGFQSQVRVPIQLADMYVSLRAQVDLRGSGESEFGTGDEARDAVGGGDIPLIDAFPQAWKLGGRRGLILLGDPGSGKTTHLKRMLLWMDREDPADIGLDAGYIPLFLPLRDLDDPEAGFDAFLAAHLTRTFEDQPADLAQRLLAHGKLLLLFDGLDEVAAHGDRVRVAGWIARALERLPRSRALVSCRYAGYDKDVRFDAHFLELHLLPLEREQADEFVRNWFRTVETALDLDTSSALARATLRAEQLVERLAQPDARAARILELTRNPLLLTAICLVFRDGGRLPDRRVDLYEECVQVLLERWRRAKDLDVSLSAREARQVLQPVALWLHQVDGRTSASAAELAPVLEPELTRIGRQGTPAEEFLLGIRDESGLLTGWSGRDYGFLHLGFQEFLAAREIRARAFEDHAVLDELVGHFGESWWNEVLLLLLALGDPPLFEPLMRRILARPGMDAHDVLLRFCLEDTAAASSAPFLELLKLDPAGDEDLARRQETALNLLQSVDAAIVEGMRTDLARHPNPRIRARFEAVASTRSVRREALPKAPDVVLVAIPGGRFTMGSPPGEHGRFENEAQHLVELSPYFLSRTPVTNAQYGRFLADQGGDEPQFWADRRYNQPEQPVVGVSWEEARAYCAWAGGDLPSEAQWEYACRAGTTGAYSCEEGELAEHAWYWESKVDTPQPVARKRGNPWGLFDMHGNVWEWCADWHGEYPSEAQRDPLGPAEGSVRVVRGGGYRNSAVGLRSALRFRDVPGNRWFSLGFRVALSPPRAD